MRLFITLLTFAFATQAHASFGANDCKSADGEVSYKYRFIWSNPVTEDFWTINGVRYEASSYYADGPGSELLEPTIKTEALSERQTLESSSTSMTGSSTYAYKVKLTYQDAENKTAERVEWVICSSAGGI